MNSDLRNAGNWLMLFCAAVLGVAAVAQAQNPFEVKQFSATVVMSGMPAKAGQGDMKIYRSADKMRMSMGSMGYMVMDLVQHTNYMVMGGGAICMQMNAAGQHNPFADAQGATIDRSAAGSETIDGHACKVENVTVTPHQGQPTKMKVWEAEDLKGFPVKVEMQSKNGPITLMYKDISLAEPAASLFTHPDNCQQMPSMPGGPH
jgi:hypothetical protein